MTPPYPPTPSRPDRTRPDLRPARTRDAAASPPPTVPAPRAAHDARHLGPTAGRHRPVDRRVDHAADRARRLGYLDATDPAEPDEPTVRYDGVGQLVVFVALVVLLVVAVLWGLPYLLV